LIGFTDPIDLVKKFGTNWMFRGGEHAEARIFNRYVSDAICTNIFSGKRSPYYNDPHELQEPVGDGAR
jgi:hypothetical protein